MIKRLISKARPNLPEVLPQPERKANIPDNAKWLSGEGAGSWFVLKMTDEDGYYLVSRLSPEGKLECISNFKCSKMIDINMDFQITYPANCKLITIIQEDSTITLHATAKKFQSIVSDDKIIRL